MCQLSNGNGCPIVCRLSLWGPVYCLMQPDNSSPTSGRERRRRVKKVLPERVSFRIDERMRDKLKERCDKDFSSPSEIVRRALKQYLFAAAK